MSGWVKFAIGLAAALLIGWLHHGPLGAGARFVDGLERQAQAAVAQTNVPGVTVRLGHDPLSRHATLSGPADAFQREGQGELKGINDWVAEIEGISGYHWADDAGGAPTAMPLLAELLILVAIAYLAGLGLGWLLFGRRRDDDGLY
ncbi:hypothetical protein [Allosphingosinicella vermicomposti]|uniref:hypothetical protein n=1 Tax=Allosphingosinicella vermicomposti TaxID=614671 RepID=UPI00131A5CC2|nr:hypothetical protein [Allosphingosinicella vermicomposti]